MGLSERDESALKLGRLVLATILERPENVGTDSLSRFFFDSWLAKSGSSMADADSFSIDLLSKLQKQIAQVQEHALLHSDANADAEEKGEEKVPGLDAENEMQSKKSVAAVSLEALDRVISEFGRANPVLTDIRSALLPLLFVDASADEEGGGEGNKYLRMQSWCEDAHLLVAQLHRVEQAKQESLAHIERLQIQAALMAEQTQELKGVLGPLRAKLDEKEVALHQKEKDMNVLSGQCQELGVLLAREKDAGKEAREKAASFSEQMQMRESTIRRLQSNIDEMMPGWLRLPTLEKDLIETMRERDANKEEIAALETALKNMKVMLQTYQDIEQDRREKLISWKKKLATDVRMVKDPTVSSGDLTGSIRRVAEATQAFVADTHHQHSDLSTLLEKQTALYAAELVENNNRVSELNQAVEREKERLRVREAEFVEEKAAMRREHELELEKQKQFYEVQRKMLKEQVDKLSAEVQTLKGKLEKTTEELRLATVQLEKMQQKLKEAAAALADAQYNLKKVSAKLAETEAELAIKEAELARTKEALAQEKEQVALLRLSLAQALNESGFMAQDHLFPYLLGIERERTRELTAALTVAEEKIQNLEGELFEQGQVLIQTKEELSETRAAKEREKERFESAIASLKDSVASMQDTVSSLEANVESLEALRATHLQRIDALETLTSSLSALLEEKTRALENAGMLHAEQDATILRLEEEINCITEERNSLVVARGLLERNLQLKSEENQRLSDDCNGFRAVHGWTVQAVEASMESVKRAEKASVDTAALLDDPAVEKLQVRHSAFISSAANFVKDHDAQLRNTTVVFTKSLKDLQAKFILMRNLLSAAQVAKEQVARAPIDDSDTEDSPVPTTESEKAFFNEATIELEDENALRERFGRQQLALSAAEKEVEQLRLDIEEERVQREQLALRLARIEIEGAPGRAAHHHHHAVPAEEVEEEAQKPTVTMVHGSDGGSLTFSELAQKSSSAKRLVQPFLKVIRRNEALLAKEVGALAVALREAKGLCQRLDLLIADLQQEELHYYRRQTPGSGQAEDPTNSNLLSKVWSELRRWRSEINMGVEWLNVDLANDGGNGASGTNRHSFDPIDKPGVAFAEAHTAALYNEVAEDFRAEFVQAVEDLSASLRDRSSTNGGWRSLLYREDGSVDLDMALERFSEGEKVEILSEQVKYLQAQHAKDLEASRARLEAAKSNRANADRECDALREEMAALRKEYGAKGIEHDFGVYLRIKRGILDKSLSQEPVCAGEVILNHGDYLEMESVAIRAINTLLDLCSSAPAESSSLLSTRSAFTFDEADDAPLEPGLVGLFYAQAGADLAKIRSQSESLPLARARPTSSATGAAPTPAATSSKQGATATSRPAASPSTGQKHSTPALPSLMGSSALVLPPRGLSPAGGSGGSGRAPANDWKAIERAGRQKRAMEQFQTQTSQTRAKSSSSIAAVAIDITVAPAASNNPEESTEAPAAEEVRLLWEQQWSSDKTKYLVRRLRESCEKVSRRVLFARPTQHQQQQQQQLFSDPLMSPSRSLRARTPMDDDTANWDAVGDEEDDLEQPGSAVGEGAGFFGSSDFPFATSLAGSSLAGTDAGAALPPRSAPTSSSLAAGCYDTLTAVVAATTAKADTDAVLFARKVNRKINKHIAAAREAEELLKQMSINMTPKEVVALQRRHAVKGGKVLAPVALPPVNVGPSGSFSPARGSSSPATLGRLVDLRTLQQNDSGPRIATPPLSLRGPESSTHSLTLVMPSADLQEESYHSAFGPQDDDQMEVAGDLAAALAEVTTERGDLAEEEETRGLPEQGQDQQLFSASLTDSAFPESVAGNSSVGDAESWGGGELATEQEQEFEEIRQAQEQEQETEQGRGTAESPPHIALPPFNPQPLPAVVIFK